MVFRLLRDNRRKPDSLGGFTGDHPGAGTPESVFVLNAYVEDEPTGD